MLHWFLCVFIQQIDLLPLLATLQISKITPFLPVLLVKHFPLVFATLNLLFETLKAFSQPRKASSCVVLMIDSLLLHLSHWQALPPFPDLPRWVRMHVLRPLCSLLCARFKNAANNLLLLQTQKIHSLFKGLERTWSSENVKCQE